MHVIGLTGGIASGKSVVAQYLHRLGAEILDADAIAYQLSQPDQPIWQAYVQRYGNEVLLPNGDLNRRAAAEKVFTSESEKAWLNSMAHPLIRFEMESRLETLKRNGNVNVFLDVPLLYEAGWESMVEAVWVVYVSADIQKARLMKRNAFSSQEAERRIKAQMPIEEKKEKADVVIYNLGDLEHTMQQVEAAWRGLL